MMIKDAHGNAICCRRLSMITCFCCLVINGCVQVRVCVRVCNGFSRSPCCQSSKWSIIVMIIIHALCTPIFSLSLSTVQFSCQLPSSNAVDSSSSPIVYGRFVFKPSTLDFSHLITMVSTLYFRIENRPLSSSI